MQYSALVKVYEEIASTTKRLEKTKYLSVLLKNTPSQNLSTVLLLLRGRVFATWDKRKLGVAARLVLKAINVATGIDAKKIEDEWKKTGDLGIVAENLAGKKTQATLFSQELDIKQVFDNLQKLSTLEGAGTVDRKIKLIAQLLTSAKPVEARYIVRTVLEELRAGIGEGSIRDAILWAYFSKELKIHYDKEKNELVIPDKDRTKYNEYLDIVQRAIDLTNDFATVAKIASTKGLEGLQKIELKPQIPVKVMLYQKAKDIKDAFERVGKPAAFEYKYDGFRLQVHKVDNKISLYTRRLEEVTKQFPEVVEYTKKHVSGDSFVLDAEAVGFDKKSGKYLPFQKVSQRIKRKYGIKELADKMPVEVNVFDILQYNGKTLLDEQFKKRRAIIAKIIDEQPKQIICAKQLITDSVKAAQEFYGQALKSGEEGIMAKNLSSPYKPGSRVGYGVKIKPTMDELDLVIVGAEWGEGKRSGWLTSFAVACQDEDGNILNIGKVGTGIKELEQEGGVTFEQLTELLKPLIIKEKGKTVTVKPKIIIEVRYEEIQKSPAYKSSYALRFPRLVRLREDRGLDDISNLETVEDLYYGQKK
ncbi:ATP-dependent DNA ligase [Candidatus Woesearchaeota archaeon]|nr:ATP-dependent DNA ligase [Candidatus Woesearchaeota archaeon]